MEVGPKGEGAKGGHCQRCKYHVGWALQVTASSLDFILYEKSHKEIMGYELFFLDTGVRLLYDI